VVLLIAGLKGVREYHFTNRSDVQVVYFLLAHLGCFSLSKLSLRKIESRHSSIGWGQPASNDGKSFGLNQYYDLPPGTEFIVSTHSPTETIVHCTQTDCFHTIPHNDSSRLHIAWWPKCWSDTDRKRTSFYHEVDTFLWSLAKSHFYALSTTTLSMPTAITFPSNGSGNATKDSSLPSLWNSSLTSRGFTPT
jgi:hypothetical protein